MKNHIQFLYNDVLTMSSSTRTKSFTNMGLAEVTLFGKRMNHDVFLAKVRYLLVVYLIEQTLNFCDELNAR